MIFILYMAQEPFKKDSYRVRSTVYSDMWEKIIDLRLEPSKILVTWEAIYWMSVHVEKLVE